jgi:hypothetical protein
MKLAQATKLHGGDQVAVKATHEVVTVIDAYRPDDRRFVAIEVVTRRDGFSALGHRDVS